MTRFLSTASGRSTRASKSARASRRARLVASRRRLCGQTLESRRLLAGDVDVFIRHDSLVLRGDADDNSVEIVATSVGDIVVSGKDGTTINGEAEPFVIAGAAATIERDLIARLGRGDNTLLVDGVTIGDDFVYYGGRDDDSVGLLRTDVGDDVTIRGGRGDFNFSLDISNVGDDLRISSFGGSSTIVVDDSLIADDTSLLLHGDEAFIVVRDSVHADDVFIRTGGGEDFVAVIGSELGDDTFLLLGSGDDSLYLEDVEFGDRVIGLAGRGDDAVEAIDITTTRDPLLLSFEGSSVAGASDIVDLAVAQLVDAEVRRPTLVDIATSNPDFSILVDLLIQADLVGAISTDDPLTVFAPNNDAFVSFVSEFGLTFEDGELSGVSLDVLTSVLLFHVAAGNVDSSEVLSSESIESLQGEPISVSLDPPTLDARAGLLAVDIRARNGIIHVVNTVLTPSILDGEG